MKGLLGIVIAGALGMLGVGINMVYLHNKTKNIEMISFVGIKHGVTISIGESIKLEDLEPVAMPLSRAQTLEKFVFKWSARSTIAGIKATKQYQGGELVFIADYKTPKLELKLAPDEVLLPIDVASKSALIDVADEVSFLVSTVSYQPTPSADGETEGASEPVNAMPPTPVKMHGPFRVGAIGNRISSKEVMQAYRIPQQNSNQLGIIVKREGDQLEARAMTLLAEMQKAGARSVTVVLHARGKK